MFTAVVDAAAAAAAATAESISCCWKSQPIGFDFTPAKQSLPKSRLLAAKHLRLTTIVSSTGRWRATRRGGGCWWIVFCWVVSASEPDYWRYSTCTSVAVVLFTLDYRPLPLLQMLLLHISIISPIDSLSNIVHCITSSFASLLWLAALSSYSYDPG